jgi:hypothetical protein
LSEPRYDLYGVLIVVGAVILLYGFQVEISITSGGGPGDHPGAVL